jgi:hypothetical protein
MIRGPNLSASPGRNDARAPSVGGEAGNVSRGHYAYGVLLQ